MQKPFYLYVRFCRLFGLTPLHFRGKLLIPAEADTICVNLASYGLDDTHALAYVLTLMRIANLPPAVMLKFLRAYLRTCGTSAAEQVIQTAVDSSAMEQLLSFDAPTSSDVKRTQFSYWHFEGNPLTGKGASLVVAAAIILGGGHLELEMSNCPQVFDLELTAWLDLIEYLRQERGSAPFGLRGLRVDGCPLQKFTCQPDRILTDLEWLSLRGTAFKNLWTTASLLTELPSLRAILIRGSPKTMRQLDHVRKISLGLGNRNSRPSSDSAASSGGSYRSSTSQSGPEIERHNVELKKSSDVESVYVRARPRWAHLRGNDAVPDEIPYLQYRRDVLNGQDWKITAETPVSRRAHYREFLLAHAKPALISLDAVPLTARECEIARRDVLRHFDVVLPDPPHNPATLFRQIRDRELEISNSHAVIWTKSRSSLDSNPKRRRNGNYDQPSDGGSSAEPHGLRKISAVDNGLSSLGRIHREESANLGGTATRSSISSSAALEAFSGRVFNLVSAECANFVKGQSEKMPSVLDGQSRKRPVVPRSPAAYLSDNFVSSDFERDSSISLLGRPGQPRIEYLCEPHDRPRQFEYNHIDPRLLVYGTEHANLVVLNQDTGTVVGSCRTGGGKGHIAPGASVRTNRSELPGLSRPCNLPVDEEQSSSVLGLSWFNKDPNRFIAGSESGQIHVYNVNWMQSGHNGGCMYACDTFPRLTSIHANCSDEKFIVSGYSREVGLYDLETGKQVESIRNCHQDHINVLKFAHCNPHIFVTSSFDRYVKKWDLRESRPGGSRRPIFQRQSETGNVMVCFSPDDEYLLVSAINNEVLQYTASDGRLERSFDIPKSNNSHNYTRSYYMNGRDYIISGSCTEDVVRVYNARTGQFFKEIDMDNRRGSRDRTIYVQSLRANPRHQFSFSALLSLHGNAPYLIIARTDLHSRVIE